MRICSKDDFDIDTSEGCSVVKLSDGRPSPCRTPQSGWADIFKSVDTGQINFTFTAVVKLRTKLIALDTSKWAKISTELLHESILCHDGLKNMRIVDLKLMAKHFSIKLGVNKKADIIQCIMTCLSKESLVHEVQSLKDIASKCVKDSKVPLSMLRIIWASSCDTYNARQASTLLGENFFGKLTQNKYLRWFTP